MGDLSGWDVSNVKDFSGMFYYAARDVASFNFGNLGKWNVSSAEDMSGMFCSAGTFSTKFYLGDLQNWNTANVTDMGTMFSNAGLNASWSLNCRNWNVKKVDYHVNFDQYVENKVTEPVWVN